MELIVFNLALGAAVISYLSTIRTGVKRGLMSSVVFALTLVFACLTTGVLLVTTVILLVIAVWLPEGTSRRRRLQINLGVTALVVAMFLIPGVQTLLRRKATRELFPIVSLNERLKFESQTLADPQSAISKAYEGNRTFSGTVSDALSRMDDTFERNRWSDRTFQLRSLHEDESLAFAQATGFGVGRMVPAYDGDGSDLLPTDFKLLPELPAEDSDSFVPFEGGTIRKAEPPEGSVSKVAPIAGDAEALAKRTYLATNAISFVPSETLGYVAGKQQAAGFVPHRFIEVPELADSDRRARRWEIVRLELVSLLKSKQPRVYVSKDLPQMEKLQSVPTRSLDEFETKALTKLWHDEDVVIDEEPQRIRMLGSLRAATKCLECHSVKRGQLLGAFSYELRQRR